MRGAVLDAPVAVSTLVFVATSRITMGRSLTVDEVLASRRNGRLVLPALVVILGAAEPGRRRSPGVDVG